MRVPPQTGPLLDFESALLLLYHACTSDALRKRRTNRNGAVAQLGERLNGIQEVRGSIPLGSTKKNTPDNSSSFTHCWKWVGYGFRS